MHRVMFVLQTTAIGGMESHVVDLAAELTRRAVQVQAVIPSADRFDPLVVRFSSAGAEVARVDTDGRNGRPAQLRQLLSLRRRMTAWRPDVVHLHLGGATGGTAVVALARLAGAVAVVTEHDVPTGRPAGLTRASRLLLDRWAHVLIAISRRNAALRIAGIRPRLDRFAVVLNGVPIPHVDDDVRSRNRREVRAEQHIGSSRTVVGSVVRLANGKGLPDLIRAFASVHSSSPNCDLLLVGDGPLRSELEALADSFGIADVVHFAGNQREPGRFLDAFDVFALAVPEGSGSIAVLEAMARGVPSLITFGGPEEAIRPNDSGVWGPPNDPEGLAAALAPLVENAELRARFGRAAAAHVQRHYSVSRVADDLLELYSFARRGVAVGLRADAPADARPGDRARPASAGT